MELPKSRLSCGQQGNPISERTTGKYMREIGICARWVKHCTRTTIHSDFDQVWVSDITYIWTRNGFVYLTSVMDLFSRRILAWTLSPTLETKYVVETIQKAIRERNGARPRIFHYSTMTVDASMCPRVPCCHPWNGQQLFQERTSLG
ncbi:MAG: transposase [Eubacterium sp.]